MKFIILALAVLNILSWAIPFLTKEEISNKDVSRLILGIGGLLFYSLYY